MSKRKTNSNQNHASDVELVFSKARSPIGSREPVTEQRLNGLRQLYQEMLDEDDEGNPLYPTQTQFVTAAAEAGYTAREIATLLGKKPQTIQSTIWRVRTGYKPLTKAQRQAAEDALEAQSDSE